jgi:hypothetical protein
LVITNQFEGQNEFFSKIGFEIRAGTQMVIAKRAFNRSIPLAITMAPKEGDLIYAPIFRKLFEIKHSDEDVQFYTHGRRAGNPYVFQVQLEAFKFSQENFDTGIEEVDEIEDVISYTQGFTINIASGTGHYFVGERVYQGSTLQTANASATVTNWDRANSELLVINVKGTFDVNGRIIGANSNTQYVLTSYDPLDDFATFDIIDNKRVADHANNWLDITETNPFGMP